MTRPTRNISGAAILAALISLPLWLRARAAPPAAAIGLCAPQETVYFACQTAKGKWISICAPHAEKPQYRYGKPGALELAYPGLEAPSESLHYAHYFRLQTDYTEVTFRTRDAEYAVFDYREGARRECGVRVTQPETPDLTIACRRQVRNRLPALERVLPCDPDNALNLSAAGCPEQAAAQRP